MSSSHICNVRVSFPSIEEIRSRLRIHFADPHKKYLIVSLNPEHFVDALHDSRYATLLSNAEIQLADGVGTVFFARAKGICVPSRITGVDFLTALCKEDWGLGKMKILFLGGGRGVAQAAADYLTQSGSRHEIRSSEGYQNVHKPTSEEEKNIHELCTKWKPDVICTAFGAPAQEKWFESHAAICDHAICLPVGGALDYLAGTVSRAPLFIQEAGMEWLYRLCVQPWRWRRQIKLITFMLRVFYEIIFSR